jgi:hypothetical protein
MRFDVVRDRNRGRTILLVAAGFIVFSVLAFFLAGGEVGVTLLAISGVFLVSFAIEQGKIGWYYEITDDAVVVRRTFRRYSIPGSSIQSVKRGTWADVHHAIKAIRSTTSATNRQVSLGRLIGFSSIPIPVRSPWVAPRDDAKERFVVLRKENGRDYILSPADWDSFIKEAQRLMSRCSRS